MCKQIIIKDLTTKFILNLIFFFSDLKITKPNVKMSKSYNLANIEKMIKDPEAPFFATDDKIRKELEKASDQALELYSEKIDEYNNNLSMYLLDIVPTKSPNIKKHF